MTKLFAKFIYSTTDFAHKVLSKFVNEKFLAEWKPIHLCWWFIKHDLVIPQYFIGVGAPVSYWLEPGGDADFGIGLWTGTTGTAPTVVQDFVHGFHQYSIQPSTSASGAVYRTGAFVTSSPWNDCSVWVYFNALPSSGVTQLFGADKTVGGTHVWAVQITSGGVLQFIDAASGTQIGSNGATLTTGVWYRISVIAGIGNTSGTGNLLTVYVNGVSSITASAFAITNIGAGVFWLGTVNASNTCDVRYSDIWTYTGGASNVADPGNLWVTAKRPVSNGTTNGFTTQIGSGGSGYGSGHAPQVNERPASTTNGWSMVGAGSAVTEEYTIEGQSVGDVSIVGATQLFVSGWIYASSLAGETANTIINNVATGTAALTSTPTFFTLIATATATYPVGGTDIGIKTTTALTTVSLYECGILIGFVPSATTVNSNFLAFM
jgi:hypothetical protein